METGFTILAEGIQQRWGNLNWRLKAQVLVFLLSLYLGIDGLTVSRIFDGLDLIRPRCPQIRAIS